MEIKKILITPSMAKEMLESNIANRNLKLKVVEKYAADMIAGNWIQDTGEMICISILRELINGQHRLRAVIKSNTSQYFHVAYDVPDEAKKVIDTGSSRKASDIFSIDGVANALSIPSIISYYIHLRNGNLGHKASYQSSINYLNIYNERPEFYQNVFKITKSYYNAFSKILNPSTIGGFYLLFSSINQKNADDFFDQLCTGNNITNSSISSLRKKLTDDKISANKKMTAVLRNTFIIKTWNHFRKNEVIKILKFDFEKEKYPKAI
jgi:hypothetical protein